MSRLRVRNLGDSTHSGPEDYGHVRVRCHLWDGLADSFKVVIDCERRRVTAYTQDDNRMVFQGGRHDILPQTVFESKCQGQLAGWLASLTLEDEVRPDLDLPPVVCECVDVFLDELPGLPPHRDVDFGIELHPGTTTISMTPHRMAPVELQELRVQLQGLLDKGFIRPSTSPWDAPVLLRKRRTRSFDCALTTGS